MTTPKPSHIDLRAQSQASIARPLKSPRIHVAGDVPPELSPLDAFALQSRLLAKQLEESARSDRRLSRLPPLTTESPLVLQGRSEYFRSLSQDSYSDNENGSDPQNHHRPSQTNFPLSNGPSPAPAPATAPASASASASSQPSPAGAGGFSARTPEVEEPAVRPQSMHPRMSRIPFSTAADDDDDHGAPPPVPVRARGRRNRMQAMAEHQDETETPAEAEGEPEAEAQPSLFGARRERSPSPLVDDVFDTRPLHREREPEADMTAPTAENAAAVAPSPHLQPEEPAQAERSVQQQQPQQPQPAPEQAQPPQPQSRQPWQLQLPPPPLQRRQPPQLQQQFYLQQQPLPQPPPQHPAAASLSPFSQSPERLSRSALDLPTAGLAPPRSLFPKRSSSILSAPLDLPDDDSHSALGSSYHSLGAPRKLSNSSGMVSPGLGSFHRSPSFGSDMSAPLPRPSFNFSRPLSRVGTPSLESPARQASSDSHTSYSQSSFVLADDTANTPVSMHSEGFPDSSSSLPDDAAAAAAAARAAAPSYIYSKFSLPRGKMLQRMSAAHGPDGQPTASYHWEQPMQPPSNVQTLPLGGQAPPSPPSRPSSSAGSGFPRPSLERPSLERTKLSTEMLAPSAPPTQPSPNPSRPSTDGGRSFDEGSSSSRGRPLAAKAHDTPTPGSRGRTPMSVKTTTTSGGTSDSASTIKPRSMRSLATAMEIPADEHVDKGIALHEQGLLNESTYHLRHAARQGHPTGMLLYALACRHGWGMRANPREGAEWLRKAADCASIEIADDEALVREGKSVDVVDRKTRKAQFALSIYELGVSYMNGWGIEQDKALALRCFEIAGSWGDVDALAEAGFCYAQGIGCKKNLKTSAKFYRQAEAKGMSMVGNSWIYKSKYNDDKESIKSPTFKDDKGRSKSRSRNIFGIKHSS